MLQTILFQKYLYKQKAFILIEPITYKKPKIY